MQWLAVESPSSTTHHVGSGELVTLRVLSLAIVGWSRIVYLRNLSLVNFMDLSLVLVDEWNSSLARVVAHMPLVVLSVLVRVVHRTRSRLVPDEPSELDRVFLLVLLKHTLVPLLNCHLLVDVLPFLLLELLQVALGVIESRIDKLSRVSNAWSLQMLWQLASLRQVLLNDLFVLVSLFHLQTVLEARSHLLFGLDGVEKVRVVGMVVLTWTRALSVEFYSSFSPPCLFVHVNERLELLITEPLVEVDAHRILASFWKLLSLDGLVTLGFPLLMHLIELFHGSQMLAPDLWQHPCVCNRFLLGLRPSHLDLKVLLEDAHWTILSGHGLASSLVESIRLIEPLFLLVRDLRSAIGLNVHLVGSLLLRKVTRTSHVLRVVSIGNRSSVDGSWSLCVQLLHQIQVWLADRAFSGASDRIGAHGLGLHVLLDVDSPTLLVSEDRVAPLPLKRGSLALLKG